MGYRGDLTGLAARRALGRGLESLGGTYTVAMVDVDRFKQFNDSHGHDVGDQVLKKSDQALYPAKNKGRNQVST